LPWWSVHQGPTVPVVPLVWSVVVVEPVVVGADGVVSAPVMVEDRIGVVSVVSDDPLLLPGVSFVVVPLLLSSVMLPVDGVLPLPPDVVSVVADGAMKLMLPDELPATLSEVIAALLPEAAAPSPLNRPDP